MTDDVLIRRAHEESAAAENFHGAEWGARTMAAPLNAMGAKVTIQKNWQELIRPNKLQVSPGADHRREATARPSSRSSCWTVEGRAIARRGADDVSRRSGLAGKACWQKPPPYKVLTAAAISVTTNNPNGGTAGAANTISPTR